MKTLASKIISLLLVLAFVVPTLSFISFGEGEEKDDPAGPEIYFNREFEEGWNYDNGFDTSHKSELDVHLSYTKMSPSRYNYYMTVSAPTDKGGYLMLPLGEDAPESGKIFFELEIKSLSRDNQMGGIIMVQDRSALGMSHIVSFNDGDMYLLGENAGIVPYTFTDLSFVIDLDYEDESTAGDDYLISVTYDGIEYKRAYTSVIGSGISAIYIGAQENFQGNDRRADSYVVDNIRLYSGVFEKCELNPKSYGVLVNELSLRDFPLEGMGGGSYLSGQPDITRVYEGAENVITYFNRHFGEGWDFDNGFTSDSVRSTLRGNDFQIDTDYSAEVNKGDGFLNYFFRFIQRNNQNGFICLDTSTVSPRDGKTYLEFDIKASLGANINCVMSFLTQGTPYIEFTAINIVNGELYIFGKNFGTLGEEWCHVIIEMDLDYGPSIGDPSAIKYTATVGEQMDSAVLIKYLNKDKVDISSFRGLRQIRIGKSSGLKEGSEGDWFGLDNLQVYSSPDGPAALAKDDYGVLVKSTNTKDFPINNGATSEITVAEIVESSLIMKVGSSNALILGKKSSLFKTSDGTKYGAPYVNEDGQVMVPIEPILEYVDSPYRFNSSGLGCDIFSDGEYRSVAIGRGYVQMDGKSIRLSALPILRNSEGNGVFYIGLDDVETIFHGFYVTYDEVGFISISTVDEYLNRDGDEDYMRELMETFLYDTPSADKLYDIAREYTNNFEHPYFFADQERFDYLYDVYNSEPSDEIYDPDLYGYIHDAVKNADYYLNKWADLDENGNYLNPKLGKWCYNSQGMASWLTYDKTPSPTVVPENAENHSVAVAPYPDTAGYDPAGGRLNVLSDGDGALSAAFEPLAFAYLVTGDEKYARFAYDWAMDIIEWPHWGPAHYLNVGETARPLAMAYDMLYNCWVELGLDPDPIRDGLSRHCTYTAWLSTTGRPQEFLRADGSESGDYWNHIGNWNPVCSAGVIVSALISFEDEENLELRERAAFTLEKTIHYLGQNGFTYFTFDGGYRESSGYWCATIRYSQYCIETLRNAFGEDFGLSNAPGIDISNYFGSHAESNEFVSWNYHDDWVREMPSFWYYMAADMFNNPEFAAIRYQHLKAGKPSHMWDAVFYDKETIEKGTVSLSLDFVMTSIDGIMSRSSWEPGALYTGILGGVNNVAHGQYDSGNWIYDNAGIRWFTDLGADDYNLYGGGLAKGYYRYSAEGQNTVAIGSIDTLPHGQTLNAGGILKSSITNQYGSATLIDQSPAYGGSVNVTYARRGMLLTNDRKTVVIQDEINLVLVQDLYWFAHYDTSVVRDVQISEDGRVAYMYSYPDEYGKTHTLRVSLVTANRGFKFQIWDTYKYVLDTPNQNYSPSNGKPAESNRDNFKKLVIEAKNVLKFELAVVIELVDDDPDMEAGYSLGWDGQKNALRPISTWVPGPDFRESTGGGVTDGDENRPSPSLYGFVASSKMLSDLMEDDPLGENRESFFKLMASMEYCLLRYGREFDDDELLDAIELYEDARSIYDRYYTPITDTVNDVSSIAKSLVGIG